MNSTAAAHLTNVEELLGKIADEFTERLNRGEQPDIEEYAGRHPEIAPLLRQVPPALGLIRVAKHASPAEDALETGILGDFRIMRELGRGGMGVVYKAEQISLGRKVALKVLPFAGALDPRQLTRFQNEARAAACLHHPNIVPVYFVGCERAVHFYAMQYIEGQSLEKLILDLRLQILDLPKPDHATAPTQSAISNPKSAIQQVETAIETRGRLSTLPEPRHTRAYFRRVAELGMAAAHALEHAHELGVVHRDIKPANLMLDGRGKLWITDFGLAQIRSDTRLTLTGDLVGTLRYMSPEQALAKRVIVDHRTDIYSLGATLYELLTLEPVFSGDDRQELLRQIAFEEPKPLRRHNKSIPAELETIVLTALEKNPADRYATAKELADDLERFVKDEPISARRPSLARRLRGWCRRHKQIVTGLAVLVLTVLFVGAGSFWSHVLRSAATAQAVAEDLKEAEVWQGEEKWAKALQALERAKGRLEGSGLAVLQARVEERLREAALVIRLKEGQVKAFTVTEYGERDNAGADRVYEEAFVAYGLHIASLPAEEIARGIRASAIRFHVVTALDYWAHVKERVPKRDAETLRAIARLVDDNPWRQRLRDPRFLKDKKVLESLADADDALTQPAVHLVILSKLLGQANAQAAEVRLLRQAQKRYPADFWITMELAMQLRHDPRTAAEAVVFSHVAVALQPQSSIAYNVLASFLEKWPEKSAAYRKATELSPNNAGIYEQLGTLLYAQQKLSEAEAAYRKAIKLKPDLEGAYHNLGCVLYLQQKLPEAAAASKEAIKLQPNYPNAYSTLANILRAQERLAKSADAQRKATEQDNGAAECNLGFLLMGQGEFAEALGPFKRGHEPGFRRPRWYGDYLRWANGWLELDAKLPRILKGEIEPADAAERLDLADFCQLRCRQFFAASARFYSEAFAAEPGLVDEARTGIRYGAACAAAQAGCGHGKDAGELDAEEYVRLRRQAFAWLRADLAGWRLEFAFEPAKARNGVRYEMRKWQEDPALDSVRGADAQAKLPEAERLEWRRLWEEVEELMKRAEKK